jgi:hypothetical protein
MAKITLENNQPRKDFPIPAENSLHETTVTGIRVKTWPDRGDGRGETQSLEFEFTIKTPGEFEDKRIWGTVPLWFSMNPNCRLRNWVQSILGTELESGYELDTDDLIGRNARIVVGHREGKNASAGRTFAFVADVLPSRVTAATSFAWDNQPTY